MYKFNLNLAIIISEDIVNIISYSDSDWTGDSFINHSITGYIFMNAENPIICESKKQPIVALFICETEYITTSDIARVAT
jgi:hypothetical protein